MLILQSDLQQWLELQGKTIDHLYEIDPSRLPKNYKSNEEAFNKILIAKELAENQLKIDYGKKKLGIGEAAMVIVENVALTAVPVPDGYSLAIYDYDKKIYTFNTATVLNDYIVALMGMSSQNVINSMITTLIGLRQKMAHYNPLPKYKIAVGNGIYNCLTKRLEPFDPRYTVLTKIKTNLKFNARRPKYADGFTLEGMIESLANGSIDRQMLLGQICKSILTGHNLKPGLFVILGKGGDGKSTFFTMVANMIGAENVAYVNFSELDSPDKMLETMNKKLVLGLDNDVKVYIKKTALLKTISSHEMITLSRKYLSAISIPFTATVVQLCNEFPRIAETGSSMKRRIVPFKAENSHYENKTENDNIDNVYIKDTAFLEYALWYFLNDETNPYYSDYNDVDRKVAIEALDAEDAIGQFVADLEQDGVLSEINEYIPTAHIYAAYQDWMKVHNPGSQVLSARGFSLKIGDKLYDAGYSLGERDSITRPSSLEKLNQYSYQSWGYLKDLPNLKETIESNRPSRLFVKTHEGKPKQEIRRNSHVITALEYFKVDVEIENFLQPNDKKADEYDIDQFNKMAEQFEIENNEKIENNEPIIELEEVDDVDDHKDDVIVKFDTSPPHDIRVILNKKESNKIKEYLDWINALTDLYSNKDINDAQMASTTDTILSLINQTAYQSKDPTLVMMLNSEYKDLIDKIRIIKKFINQYSNTYIKDETNDS